MFNTTHCYSERHIRRLVQQTTETDISQIQLIAELEVPEQTCPERGFINNLQLGEKEAECYFVVGYSHSELNTLRK